MALPVHDRCPGCEDVTTQHVTKRYSDGSGFTRCQRCEKQIVHMAGTIPRCLEP